MLPDNFRQIKEKLIQNTVNTRGAFIIIKEKTLWLS